jgi:hypothetical protein
VTRRRHGPSRTQVVSGSASSERRATISIPVMAARSWASMATPPGAASSQSSMAATDEAQPS